MSYYKGVATQLSAPDVEADRTAEVQQSEAPLTLINAEARQIWDLTLQEAVQITLTNSKVIRSLGAQAFVPSTLAGGSRFGDPQRLISTPTTDITTFAPSIIESDPRFGTEAALSAFDAQFSSSLFWNKNHQARNFQGLFSAFQSANFLQDLATNTNQLQKRGATGGLYSVRTHNNYEMNNNGSNLYHNFYQSDVEAEFNHPLLQGAGAQFNRIAGPGNVAGFYNGVSIARINHDIALADLEVAIRNMINEVEAAYWRLYFNYRDLDARMAGRDSALTTWRKVYALYLEGARGGEAEKEAQARGQYFLFRAQVEGSLSDLYTSENQLRYMMGIAPTDGRLIRPATEPTTARVEFDWQEANTEGLARSAEIRQQKWRVKQHELQLMAAKNFLLPRLDFDALYRWRGFGNNLFFPDDMNVSQAPGVANPANPSGAWNTLLDGKFQEWQLGFNFSMPLGFRQAMAAVRNEQLQLARERAVLQDQELELTHQLSNALRSLDRHYTLSQTNFNRRVATQREVDAVNAAYQTQTVTLDLLLQAQQRLADAESSYYDSLALYNQSISQVHLRKGSLLEYSGVVMAEGPWADKAYRDAMERARERSAGMKIDYGFTRPNVFSRGPIPQTSGANPGTPAPSEQFWQSPTNPGEPVPAPAPVPEKSEADSVPGIRTAATMDMGASPEENAAPNPFVIQPEPAELTGLTPDVVPPATDARPAGELRRSALRAAVMPAAMGNRPLAERLDQRQ
jgi:outer membrane protein TolC